MLSDIVKVEGEIFYHHHDSKNHKRQEDRIGEEVEDVIQIVKGAGIVAKLCHLALQKSIKDVIQLKMVLMPKSLGQFEIGLR
jgi:hypothetical protein